MPQEHNPLLSEQELKSQILLLVLDPIAELKYGMSFLLLDKTEQMHVAADAKEAHNKVFDLVQSQKIAHGNMVIGETRQYKSNEPCPRCSGQYQYKCNCADAEEALQVEQRERNK